MSGAPSRICRAAAPAGPARVAAGLLVTAFALVACSSGSGSRAASAPRSTTGPTPTVVEPGEHADLFGGYDATTTMPLSAGATGTFGGFFLVNRTDDAIDLETVSPIGGDPTQVNSIHISVLNEGHSGVGTAVGFPPPGLRLEPVEHHTVAPHSRGTSVIFEVRRGMSTTAPDEVFKDVTIRYHRGGRLYQTTINQGLTLTDPAEAATTR